MSVEVMVIVAHIVALLLALALPDRPIPKCPPDCGIDGSGIHVHSAEGRSHMTPEQRVAARESIRRARRRYRGRS